MAAKELRQLRSISLIILVVVGVSLLLQVISSISTLPTVGEAKRWKSVSIRDTIKLTCIPGTEICNNLDDNCNSQIDEGCDDDNDDYCDSSMTTVGNPSSCPNGGGDCNDLDSNVMPRYVVLTENRIEWTTTACTDGVDTNCNGVVDEGCEAICDDIDNDNNGLTDDGCDDDGDGYCDSQVTIVGTPLVCPSGSGDCADFSGGVNPGSTETCFDMADNNCDGVPDNDCAPYTCTDSDPNQGLSVGGIVTVTAANGEVREYKDRCSGNNNLIQYHCGENTASSGVATETGTNCFCVETSQTPIYGTFTDPFSGRTRSIVIGIEEEPLPAAICS